jgi:hypothetical protein
MVWKTAIQRLGSSAMKLKKWSISGVVLFAGCFCGLANICNAASFHSTSFGYTVTVPDDWKQIPDDVMHKTMEAAMNPNAPRLVDFDAAFQLKSKVRWFTYPYVMMEVIPYANVGQGGQINEDQFPAVLKSITGADVKKAMDSTVSDKLRSSLGQASFGQANLDSANRRYSVPLTMTVAGIGQVRGQLTGFFGKECIVQVATYVKSSDWDQHPGEYSAIEDSFRFDPDKAYSVAEAVAHPSRQGFNWAQSGNSTLIGVVAGGIVALVCFAIFKARQNSK